MWNDGAPATASAERRDEPGRDESGGATTPTSLDKALDLCEALSQSPRGLSISELSRQLRRPAPTVHRLLAVLKRRGYVQQDEETSRYRLTLRMLDLSFRMLGRSELRLHAYPVLRDYVLRTGMRAFLARPDEGDVTYVWSTGPDAVAMHTVYGKAMPGHCSLYFTADSTRRLSCLKLERGAGASGTGASGAGAAGENTRRVGLVRLGPSGAARAGQQLACTCAPVVDYAGRDVARVGVFAHDVADEVLTRDRGRDARELARLISLRLGSTLDHGSVDVA
jgi:DNA-binding IclR family transcriptional regulator